MKTRITLVRHCETRGNIDMLFQGTSDTPITENGYVQLDLLSVRLRNDPIDVIYTSPLKRAVKTAEAINRFHNVPVIYSDGLKEIHGGVWEGNPIMQYALLYPDDEDAWANHPCDFAPKGGESMKELFDRVSGTLKSIAADNMGKNVCVVSHGCAIRNMLCFCSGKPFEEISDVPWGVNTSVSCIDFKDNGEIEVIMQDDCSHLPERPKTYCVQSE